MKVLQIIADGSLGGGTTFVLEMLRSLPNRVLITQDDSYLFHEAQRLGIDAYGINFFTSRLDLRISYKLHQLMRRIAPDIIHVHGTRAAFFLSFCTQTIPTLYTIHGFHGVHTSKLIGRWGIRLALRKAKHVVCVSKWEEHLARTHTFLSHSTCHVIPNGVCLDTMPQRQPPQPKLIGFIGRLTPSKDPLFMVEIMNHLAPLGYHLKIIGGGELEQALSNIPSITVTGILEKKQALKELSNVSCVIVPSKWEAFGLVVIESMAIGIPVIAAKIPPFEELITHGKTGVLIDQKDPQLYAAAIIEGLNYSKAAQHHVRKHFSWNHCFDAYQSIFSELKRENR